MTDTYLQAVTIISATSLASCVYVWRMMGRIAADERQKLREFEEQQKRRTFEIHVRELRAHSETE